MRRWTSLTSSALVVTTLLACCVALAGCTERATSSGSTRRIVCLSPAVTQMLIDLGIASEIVGVGRHDPVAPAGSLVVGDLMQLDYERLVSVSPTHVFLQPGARGVPGRLKAFADSQSWVLGSFDIETIDDALTSLYDPSAPRDTDTVAGALGMKDQARLLSVVVQARLHRLAEKLSERSTPKVLLVVGASPITVAGPGTFLGELLEIAGGRNAISSGKLYPTIDLERVLNLAPEVVVFAHSTTGQMGKGRDQLEVLLSGLDVPAVRDGRIHEVFDTVMLLPSTSMPRVAAKLAVVLHPAAAGSIQKIIRDELAP